MRSLTAIRFADLTDAHLDPQSGSALTNDSFWTRSLVVVLGAAMLAVASGALVNTARAQTGPCGAVMKDMMAQGGVRPRDTKSVEYDISTGANGTGPIHMSWYRLHSCQGYVVSQTTEHCMILQQFTLGTCTRPATQQSRLPSGGS